MSRNGDTSDGEAHSGAVLPSINVSTSAPMADVIVRMTPRSSYQRISGHSVNEQHHMSITSSNRQSFASIASVDRKFMCQFDPLLKNGKSLVLKFDEHGDSSFLEMSRMDVLKMAQDAARPAPGTEHIIQGAGSPRRSPGRAPHVTVRTKRVDSIDGGYRTICDVQRVHARDIRKLDNAFAVSNEPSFVLRRQAILINADPVRAIIMRDACLVFVPDGADSLLMILREKFKETAQQDAANEVPYEFKALEALLATLCRYFEADYEKTSPIISSALDRLVHGHISSGELETLRVFKNTMDEFESQVDGIRRMLMEILDNEEDLRLLYLTKLHEDPSLLGDLFSFDSEEAEVLIENYLQDIFSTRTKATLMQHRIQNTESLVMLKLDSMRNYLLGVDLIFSLVAISLSVGTYITGAFGMNLNSHLEDEDGWFWSVVLLTMFVFVTLTSAGIWFFRKKGVLL